MTRPVHIGPDPSEVCTLPEYDSPSIRPCPGEAHAHADLDQAAPPSRPVFHTRTVQEPSPVRRLQIPYLLMHLQSPPQNIGFPSLPSLLSPSHSRFQLMQVDRSFHLGAPGSVMIDISRMPSFLTSPRGPAAFAQSLPFFNICRRQLTRPHLPIFPQSPQSPPFGPPSGCCCTVVLVVPASPSSLIGCPVAPPNSLIEANPQARKSALEHSPSGF
jgi:hypothetical protein